MIPDTDGRRPASAPGRHLRLLSPPDPAPPDLPLAPALDFVDVEQLVARVLRDGYVDGAPPQFTAAMDQGLCAVLCCPGCQREGLQYRPFVSPGMQATSAPGSYRPLAICTSCGVGAEF